MTDHRLDATLAQMLEAIRNMRHFTEALTFEDYASDAKTRLAVERCVEIIAEAARRIPKTVQIRHPEIPWDDIKGIGNILRHGYDKIDNRIIWGILGRHLTALEATLLAISKEATEPGGE